MDEVVRNVHLWHPRVVVRFAIDPANVVLVISFAASFLEELLDIVCVRGRISKGSELLTSSENPLVIFGLEAAEVDLHLADLANTSLVHDLGVVPLSTTITRLQLHAHAHLHAG